MEVAEARHILLSFVRRRFEVGISNEEALAVSCCAAGLDTVTTASLLGKASPTVPHLLAAAKRKALRDQADISRTCLQAVRGRQTRDPLQVEDPRGPMADGTPREPITVVMNAPADDDKTRVHANVYPSVTDRVNAVRLAFARIGV